MEPVVFAEWIHSEPGQRFHRDAGDLGRRILQRRQELNLSQGQVAERAGMAQDYLKYLEESPIAEPTLLALQRIALALEVSVPDLLGGEQSRAHGWANGPRTLA